MSKHEPTETLESLSEAYWNELLELVEHGELSARIVRSIAADMFENAPEDPPRLRRRYWELYLRQQSGDFSERAAPDASLWFQEFAKRRL